MDLCVPSQNGGLAVCLHWQSHAGPEHAAVNFLGANPLPLWAPLQKGWADESPQAQNQ